MAVSESWRRIEDWLKEHAPELASLLNPPASREKISGAEKALGVVFPPSLAESYLVHDGESKASDGVSGLWRWFSLDEIVAQNEEMKLIERAYAFGDYEPGLMIPIMEDGGGNLLYVETTAAGETPVIEWHHEEPVRDVKYDSFGAMLEGFAGRLEAGDFLLRTGVLMGLVDKDDL
ncbi:MAG: SMI1/KNR4 family protein [Rubrobacteraceae bacterium]